MIEKERIEQEKQYQKQLKKEVKAIFKKHLISDAPYYSLQNALGIDRHVSVFQAIMYNTKPDKFKAFMQALIDKGLVEYYKYGLAFNFDFGANWYGYSPLLNAQFELENYIIPVQHSKSYKTFMSDYIHVNLLDLSKTRFEDLKYLIKRVDWPEIISHSIHYGNFGNNISASIIKNHMLEIFQKDSACRYFKPGGYDGLLSIISYGLFDSSKLLDKIAFKDLTIAVDDYMINFLREYCLYENDNLKERYKELHSKYVLKYLPSITIHGFEAFYQFLRTEVSSETRLLLALM